MFSCNALASLQLSVSAESSEEVRGAAFLDDYLPLARYLSEVVGDEVKLVFTQNPTAELQRTRSGVYSMLLGPAHIIGSALRYGYEPVAGYPGEERVVIVVPKGAKAKTLEDLKGARLAMPPQDSLATYMVNGELNAKGVPPKKYFGQLRNYRLAEVALYALELGEADAVAANATTADKWMAQYDGRIVFEARPVRAPAIAMNGKLDPRVKDLIRRALLHPNGKALAKYASLDLGDLREVRQEDFSYVSTLGYFTPTVLPRAGIVTAEEARELVRGGAWLFDVRTQQEYDKGRIPEAKLLPYEEKSRKEVDYDPSVDKFALAPTVPDKNTALIFHCNGGECWKSYKAAVWALKEGYRKVYWFRGGYPEWVAKQLPIEGRPAAAADAK